MNSVREETRWSTDFTWFTDTFNEQINDRLWAHLNHTAPVNNESGLRYENLLR